MRWAGISFRVSEVFWDWRAFSKASEGWVGLVSYGLLLNKWELSDWAFHRTFRMHPHSF